jgi:hypothetical protein
MVPNELVPYRWLAKLYTEVLGCAPDQASYGALERSIRTRGCGPDALRAVALAFFTSGEFLHDRDYNNAQRLLILWRVAREPEPDPGRYYQLLVALNSGRARWGAVARSFFEPPGFAAQVPRLCSAHAFTTSGTKDLGTLTPGAASLDVTALPGTQTRWTVFVHAVGRAT